MILITKRFTSLSRALTSSVPCVQMTKRKKSLKSAACVILLHRSSGITSLYASFRSSAHMKRWSSYWKIPSPMWAHSRDSLIIRLKRFQPLRHQKWLRQETYLTRSQTVRPKPSHQHLSRNSTVANRGRRKGSALIARKKAVSSAIALSIWILRGSRPTSRNARTRKPTGPKTKDGR